MISESLGGADKISESLGISKTISPSSSEARK
jgi:hypothetical protein